MERSVLVLLAGLALVAGEHIQLFYHENEGIPAAQAVKDFEIDDYRIDYDKEVWVSDGNRIVGGSVAALGQYPFLVSLMVNRGYQIAF